MKSEIERLLVERSLQQASMKTAYVLFVDMLGFKSLTRAFPGTLQIHTDDPVMVTTSTSQSAVVFWRFQHALDTVAQRRDGVSPSRMMIFSDCAFLIFEHAPQAALLAAELMRDFLLRGVPVRMGLAFGTFHPEHFSFSADEQMTVSRAVFFGSGIVDAYETEHRSGKGCRIFLHQSVDDKAKRAIETVVPLLTIATADASVTECAHQSRDREFQQREVLFELNYLHRDSPHTNAAAENEKLRQAVAKMHAALPQPGSQEVEVQYSATSAALNRMRDRIGRQPFA